MEPVTYFYIGAAFILGYFINDLVELFMNRGKLTEEEWLEEQKRRGNLYPTHGLGPVSQFYLWNTFYYGGFFLVIWMIFAEIFGFPGPPL